MTAAAHVFPSYTTYMRNASTYVNPATDSINVALMASGTFNWVTATEAYTTYAQFKTNSGSGGGGALTEVANGNGYTTGGVALTSVTYTDSGLVNTLTCANPSWSATGSWSAVYAVFYD